MWFNELEGDINDDLPKLPSKINNNGITELSNDENLSKFKSMILNNKTSNFQPRSASFSGSLLYTKTMKTSLVLKELKQLRKTLARVIIMVLSHYLQLE